MKLLIPWLFLLMGCLFLFVGTLFFTPISQFLYDIQAETNLSVPHFWNLSFVLSFVRIIFLIVGGFLFLFGIGLFWNKWRASDKNSRFDRT